MRYAVVFAHRGEFWTSLMCRALEVSRSGFYAWHYRESSERVREEKRLLIHIRDIKNGINGTSGSQRVHEGLRAREITCSRSQVERLWYNRERRHSALGYLCPADYEAQLTQYGKVAVAGVRETGEVSSWIASSTNRSHLPSRRG